MKFFKKNLNYCFLIVIYNIVFCAASSASQAIPESNLRYPVLVTLDDGSSASGFYFNYEHRNLYFVTAKHVFFKNINNEDILKSNKALLLSYAVQIDITDPIKMELDLEILLKDDRILIHREKDIVLIRLTSTRKTSEKVNLVKGITKKDLTKGSIGSIGMESVKKYDDILPSNEVFIFGYPTSLGLSNRPQIDITKPLLRKGIIAGKNDKRKTLILDCPVYYGNSGGPCIEVEYIDSFTKRFNLIGVVSEFVPFEEKWLNVRHGLINSELENSGYSIVEPVDSSSIFILLPYIVLSCF